MKIMPITLRSVMLCLLVINVPGTMVAQDPAGDPRLVRVTLEERADDLWRVTYEISQPVEALIFGRSGRLSREDWRIVGGGDDDACRIDTFESQEALLPCDRRFRHATLEIPSNDEDIAKEYALNPPFSDGSRLFYLGHLVVERPGDPETPEHRFDLRTTPERWVVTPGQEGRGTISWTAPSEDLDSAAYAYFGPAPPVKGEHMMLLLDPGLPRWVAAEALDTLPVVFDLYRNRLGFPLRHEPMVVLSFGGYSSSGMTFRGGVLTAQIQMDVRGGSLREPDPEIVRHLVHKVAHEGFHLWNGELFMTRTDVDDAWLHEGAADYFASLALVEMDLLSVAGLDHAALENANDCILGLEGRPLLAALESGWYDYSNHYSCGFALHWVAGRVAQRTDGGWDDAWGLYRTLFREASALDHRYTGLDFVDLLRREADDLGTGIAALRLLAGGEMMEDIWSELFAAAGVEVVPVSPWGATLEQRAQRRLLARFLGSCLCGDSRATEWTAEGLRFSEKECDRWLGKELRTVEGASVRRESMDAYRRAWRRFEAGAEITAQLADGETARGVCRPGRHRPFDSLLAVQP